MSTIVQQVVAGINAVVTAQLGAEYTQLRWVFEPEANDFRTGTKAYGIRPLSAFSSDGLLRQISLNHRFEVVLMRSVVERNDDTNRFTALYELYDKASEIFKALMNTSVGAATYVWVASDPGMDEVERLPNNVLLLRINFNVNYRENID